MTPSNVLFHLTPDDNGANPTAPWIDSDGYPTATVAFTREGNRSGGNTIPSVHPGVFDATGGFTSHRLRIDFTLGNTQDALLNLEFASERGPCPDLEIIIDGTHHGIFHPSVLRIDRSGTGQPGPTAGTSSLSIPLPASWLTVGEHRIEITTVLDEAAAIGDRLGATHAVLRAPREPLPSARDTYGSWFGAYLRWNSISLHPAELSATAPSTSLRTTPFFVETDGNESPMVDLDVDWPAGTPAPSGMTLLWGAEELSIPVPDIPTDRDFGSFRWRFPAPGFTKPTSVRVSAGTASTSAVLTPSRTWDLHLIPHVHLDLGFTDTQGKVLELHCRNIDRALDAMEINPAFRFAVDGSMVVAEYTRTRSAADVTRMMNAIERGDLGVNAFHSNALTGLTSLEELYRSTDFAMTLPRSTRTAMRYANLTDVPTCTSALPGVLNALGIDGFVGMSNHGRAATPASDEIHLASPVRWQGIDGSEVLAHFADHYSQLRFVAGDPQSVAAGAGGLDRLLTRYERPDYLPSHLPVIGTHADNEDIADGDAGYVDRWNAVFSHPRFRISTFDEFLMAVLPLREQLPVWTGESGSYWEDGAGSAAAESARYRRTQVLLPATETLGAAVSASNGRYRTNRHELDRAWNGLAVGSEHTFTWSQSTSHPHAFPVADQLDWKTRFVHDAARVAADENNRHLSQLAQIVGATSAGFLAFNPHAWTTDLEAEIDLRSSVDLVGTDGLVEVETLADCAGLRRCRLALPAMAPHSYRFLPVSEARQTLPGGESTNSQSMSTDTRSWVRPSDGGSIVVGGWRVVLDPDSNLPRSLVHTGSGRELLDDSATASLGQLIRAGSRPAADAQDLSNLPEIHSHERHRILSIEDYHPGLEPTPIVEESPEMEFLGAKDTFDGARLRWMGGGSGLEGVKLDLLLRTEADFVDVSVTFTKTACHDMEAVYVAFPFAGQSPVLHYDRQLGWVQPGRDHGPGASNEWGSLTNTIALETDAGSLQWTSLDAPLWAPCDIVRGTWSPHFPSNNAHLHSLVMNNFWMCNTPPTQEGAVNFRYRFGITDGFSPAEASRFGRTARVTASIVEILPLDSFSPGATGRVLEGNLIDLGADQYTDVALRQGTDPDQFWLHIVNLVDEVRTTTLRIPDGLRATASAPGSDISTITVQLRGWGDTRVPLERLST